MAPMMTTTARPSGPPVSLLAKADELHFELVQLVEYFEEVLQREGFHPALNGHLAEIEELGLRVLGRPSRPSYKMWRASLASSL